MLRPEYKPRHRSQMEIISNYRARLDKLSSSESKVRISAFTYTESEGNVRGFRIFLDDNLESAEKGLVTDWDDTLENYSARKLQFIDKLYQSLPTNNNLEKEHFFKIYSVLNKASRILNWQQTHPEQFSPLLEMVALSKLLEDINTQSQNKEFIELLNYFTSNKESQNLSLEGLARQYLLARVIPEFGGSITHRDKNGKLYFQETQHQSLAHDMGEKPELVDPAVWSAFVDTMTATNLSEDDLENFDLDHSVYWVVSTFGAVEFQLKKIVNSLESLAYAGKRMPNEIIITTHGRKKLPILDTIHKKSIHWWYVDDSERQLNELGNQEENLTLIRAQREHTKRSGEKTQYPASSMTGKLTALFDLESTDQSS